MKYFFMILGIFLVINGLMNIVVAFSSEIDNGTIALGLIYFATGAFGIIISSILFRDY